jgi:hypothetical protein
MGAEERSKWDIVRAEIRMLTPEEGGRTSSIISLYMCECRVPRGEEFQITDCAVWLEGVDSLEPGASAKARISPSSPERWREVAIGTELELREGPNVVGIASVIEVNPIPPEARLLPSHRRSTGRRWDGHLNRSMRSEDYLEEWRRQQCGLCQYWIPLAGTWGLDWGACSNEASPFDGTVRFEHDGCDAYEEAPEWRGPSDFAEEEIR